MMERNGSQAASNTKEGRWTRRWGARWRAVIVAGAAVGAMVVGAACSLLLTWDPDQLRCETNQDCFDGYTCLVQKCVADNSLAEGDTCLYDVQCADDLFCAGFVCRKPCDEPYFPSQSCASGEYCKPILNDRTIPCTIGAGNTCEVGVCEAIENGSLYCRFYKGACVPGDPCTPGNDAGGCQRVGQDRIDPSAICVAIDAQTNACVEPCEITWQGDGDVYDDNCSAIAQQTYCQPVGRAGEQRLVCLDSNPQAGRQALADDCRDLLNDPCAEGHLCIKKSCYLHCNPDAPPGVADAQCSSQLGTAAICCSQQVLESAGGIADKYGVCVPGADCDDLD